MLTSWPRRLALALLALALAPPAFGASAGRIDRGRAIAEAHCSRCHAIGVNGESPNPLSPPFRTLHARFPVADVIGALAEGAEPMHPAMPRFRLGLRDSRALIAYVQSVQR
jgi:mono/diheme cytochrome c family protein